jgi:hypothetical protein
LLGRAWKRFMKKAAGEWKEELEFRQLSVMRVDDPQV